MKKVKIILIFCTLLFSSLGTFAQQEGPIADILIMEDTEWNLDNDYTLTNPVQILGGATLTINNTSDNNINFNFNFFKAENDFDGFNTVNCFYVEDGSKLIINGKPEAKIVFNGGNEFQLDSISTEGRYFLNNKGLESYFQPGYDVVYEDHVKGNRISTFINNDGVVEIQNANFHDFYTEKSIIKINTIGGNDINSEPNNIATFNNVLFYRNKCIVPADLNSLFGEAGASCIKISQLRNATSAAWYDQDAFNTLISTNPESIKVIIDNCTFIENYGISATILATEQSSSNLYLSSTKFERNYGSPLCWLKELIGSKKEATPYIKNCLFYKNQTEYGGGAIYSKGSLQFDSDPEYSTIISDNIAGAWDGTGGDGGGILLSYDLIYKVGYNYDFPSNLIIKNNIAHQIGGGIHFVNSMAIPDEVSFTLNLNSILLNNIVTTPDGFGRGGGICIQTPRSEESSIKFNVNMNNVKIINNRAMIGAGIYAENCILNIGSDLSSNNNIIKDNITSYTRESNEPSGYGGGIFAQSSNININDCEIFNNSANSGGGIYITGEWDNKSVLNYFNGSIFNNYALSDGGGITSLNSDVFLDENKSFGLYNNMAGLAGDDISFGGGAILQLPNVDRMRLPSKYNDLLWIEDGWGNRYRENHNDVVVEGGTYTDMKLLALGIVDFDVKLNEGTQSNFDPETLTNKYYNVVSWDFTEGKLPIDVRHIERGTKFTLWRSTDNFATEENAEWVGTIFVDGINVNYDPETGEPLYGPTDVYAHLNYKRDLDSAVDSPWNANMRLGYNDDNSSRLILLPREDEENYYDFYDNIESTNTAGDNIERYYYKMSYMPATLDDEVKERYPDFTPVAWNDTECRHSDVHEVVMPKGKLTIGHNSYSFDEIMNDGNNNEWLGSSTLIAKVNPGEEQEHFNITKYVLYNKQVDSYKPDIENDIEDNLIELPKDYSDNYILALKDDRGNTFGGNIASPKSLSTLKYSPVKSEKIDHELGRWTTTTKWDLTTNENGYEPGFYRLWFYDGNFEDPYTKPHHSHDITFGNVNAARKIAYEEDEDVDNHSFEVSDDSNIYSVTVSHTHDHGYGEKALESYRMRHYSLDTSNPDETRYIVSEATAYLKGNDDGTITGVENVAIDNIDNVSEEYYNLSGMRVYQPKKGNIYIVKRGDKTVKEIMK